MLCEVNKLLLLYFTFPVTTAPAERSLSRYLCSTINASRLNNLLLMHIHQERTEKLDLTVVAKEFSVNTRRLNYLSKIRQWHVCLH